MFNMATEALARKRRKAERYATERDRFCVDSLSATVRSEHGNRIVGFDKGEWSCTCDFFAEYRTCSHIMALEIILSEFTGLRQSRQCGQG